MPTSQSLTAIRQQDKLPLISGVRLGVRSLSVVADATDYQAMRHAAATTVETLGPYTHVVFAVGVGSGKFGFPFWNLEPGDWDHGFYA